MLKCWNKNPEFRPTFNDCKIYIGEYFDQKSPLSYSTFQETLADARRNLILKQRVVRSMDAETSFESTVDLENRNETEMEPLLNSNSEPISIEFPYEAGNINSASTGDYSASNLSHGAGSSRQC